MGSKISGIYLGLEILGFREMRKDWAWDLNFCHIFGTYILRRDWAWELPQLSRNTYVNYMVFDNYMLLGLNFTPRFVGLNLFSLMVCMDGRKLRESREERKRK